jgi:hypothetical protein
VKKQWIGVALSGLAALGLAITIAACSDKSSTTPTTLPPTTTTTTQPPAGVTLIQGSELIPKKQLFIRDVVVGQQGTIDITVEYTHADNSILFWLTDRKCSRQMFDNDACDYLAKSTSGASPRKATASSVAAGTYTFFVSNDGPQDDQVKYHLELRP